MPNKSGRQKWAGPYAFDLGASSGLADNILHSFYGDMIRSVKDHVTVQAIGRHVPFQLAEVSQALVTSPLKGFA